MLEGEKWRVFHPSAVVVQLGYVGQSCLDC